MYAVIRRMASIVLSSRRLPPTSILPSVSTNPCMAFRRDDFPHPDSPQRHTNSPLLTCSVISLSTLKSPKERESFSILSIMCSTLLVVFIYTNINFCRQLRNKRHQKRFFESLRLRELSKTIFYISTCWCRVDI